MISVIIATKNGSKTIKKAIDSVLGQSIFKNQTVGTDTTTSAPILNGAEIIVISDGSTDGVADYIRQTFASESTSGLIKILENKESVGPGAARRIAIASAQNHYIAILDDDDWWLNPDKLKNQIEFLEAHPSIAVVGAEKTEFVNEDGKHMFWYSALQNPEENHARMLMRCPVINSSVVFRKSVYDSVGGLSDLRLAEDYDLWLRIGQVAGIANIPNTETSYTLRKNSASGSNGKHSTALAKTVLMLVKRYRHAYPNYHKALLIGYVRIIRKALIGA